jgi:hypothetical protein
MRFLGFSDKSLQGFLSISSSNKSITESIKSVSKLEVWNGK